MKALFPRLTVGLGMESEREAQFHFGEFYNANQALEDCDCFPRSEDLS